MFDLMDYIYVVCEGQSEARFVKQILSPYIQEQTGYGWYLVPHTIITSTDRIQGKYFRGGLMSYQSAKNDILRCLKNGKFVTTMFDFYGLPKSFPGYDEAMRVNGSYSKVSKLEVFLEGDINSERFFP